MLELTFWGLDLTKVQPFSHALICETAEHIVPVSLVWPLTVVGDGRTTLLVVSAKTTVARDGLTTRTRLVLIGIRKVKI